MLASCIYSIAKLKQALNIKNDASLEALMAKLGLEKVMADLEIWPLFVFLSTAVFCLGCSTVFHWFHPKNHKVCKILNRLDLAGISILIYGSSIAALFYIFYCQKGWFWVYFTLLTVASTSIFGISMMDWFYLNKYKPLRTYVYIILGLFSGISLVHALIGR